MVAPPAITKTFGVGFLALNGTTTLSFTITESECDGGFDWDWRDGRIALGFSGVDSQRADGDLRHRDDHGQCRRHQRDLGRGESGCECLAERVVHILGERDRHSDRSENNTTGAVTSTEGGTGGTATASVAVVVPPSISKSFGASRIALNGTTSLSFTISNVNTVALTGVGFTDTFPGGLVVATPNGLTGSCGGGSITAVSGSNNAGLYGATLPPSSSCTFR